MVTTSSIGAMASLSCQAVRNCEQIPLRLRARETTRQNLPTKCAERGVAGACIHAAFISLNAD